MVIDEVVKMETQKNTLENVVRKDPLKRFADWICTNPLRSYVTGLVCGTALTGLIGLDVVERREARYEAKAGREALMMTLDHEHEDFVTFYKLAKKYISDESSRKAFLDEALTAQREQYNRVAKKKGWVMYDEKGSPIWPNDK